MKEEPKNIWKKSWTGPHWLHAWLMLATATFVILLISMLFLPGGPRSLLDWVPALTFCLGASLVIATVVVGLWLCIRCFFNWRNFKRLLIGLASFATLIGLFYAVENFRGKLAWNNFKREWAAKGEKFDLASFIPKPVPDDQNFALAPIWIESIRAVLGPKRARQWYGDKFPDQGRTNFTDRLLLQIWHHSSPPAQPETGDWHKAERVDLKAWQDYFRTTTNGLNRNSFTNEFPVAPQPQSPAQDVLLALSKHDAAIADLRQASRLPDSRFPLDYDSENPASILLPHLAMLKRGSIFLRLHALAALQNDQAEKAFEDVALSLRLTDSIRTEPILISHLVRLVMVQLTLQPVYEGLADHRWSDAQLTMLDAELAKLDFLADYEFCQRSELVLVPKDLEYRRRTRDSEYLLYADYGQSRNLSFEEQLRVFIFRHCPGGWFYQNQLRYCRFALENYLPILDVARQLAYPALAKRANAAMPKEVARFTPHNFIEYKLLYPIFDLRTPDGLAEKFTSGQTSVNLARTALALERYRLAHGEFPETLDMLAPQFIAKVPHDVIGGQPLHYRRTDDGKFLLYSVGWNEKDDGGAVALNKDGKEDWENGDWVWQTK